MAPVFFLLPANTRQHIIGEDGPIESASVFFYFLGAVVSWILAKKKFLGCSYSAGFILSLFALRELDFHVRFTTMGIFKTRYFLSPDVPWSEKVIVTAILLSILLLLLKFITANWRIFITAIRDRKPYAISLLSGILLLPISKLLDSSPRIIMQNVGLKLHAKVVFVCSYFEETLELAIPILFLIALLQWRKDAGMYKLPVS